MSDSVDQDIVYALAVTQDFARDGMCFAARRSGLWRTDNGGERWRKVGDIPEANADLPVTAVRISPAFRSDGSVFAAVPGGILRSVDKGNHWAMVGLASSAPVVSAFEMSPIFDGDGVMFAATVEDGVFRSDDWGVTWQAWNIGLYDLNVLSMVLSPVFPKDRTVYAATESGVFCSRNGGRAWQETGFPNNFAPVLNIALSPHFAQDGTMFAGTESCGFFYSEDRGQTWQHRLDTKTINTILLSSDFPDIPDILAVSGDNLWFSHDGGQSWSTRNHDRGPGVCYTTALAPYGYSPESKLLLGLSDGRVFWA